MQNFLGRCLALAVVGGGFTVTGDLGWLARRGARVLSATGVPQSAAEEDDAAPIPALPATGVAPIAVSGRPPAVPRGLERVEIVELHRGARLAVWLEAGVGSAAAPLVLDVVDPTSGAAILHRGGGERVRLEGPLDRGGMLRFVPLGLAHAEAPPAREALGPIMALDVAR